MDIKKCSNGHYTLKDTCPACSSRAKSAHPAKFSSPDRYGKYRRAAKEKLNSAEGKSKE